MAQRDSQLWHDIITASNQALELPKCGYHAIIFEFAPTGEPTMVDDPECRITLRDTSGREFDIAKWKTSTATKYLGAHKAPANQSQQYQTLKQKCDNFCRVINCSHLTRTETQCFYRAIYRLSANYVLPTTYFTKNELHKSRQELTVQWWGGQAIAEPEHAQSSMDHGNMGVLASFISMTSRDTDK